MNRRIRVLIVEGSAVTRRILTALLAADRAIDVVGAVPGVHDASEAMRTLRPDVVTLDVAILSRRSLPSLERFVHVWQIPIVLVSPPTRKARELTVLALELGAVDVVRMWSLRCSRR
jgi:two-component system chemotaxis response regulator CheB